MLRRCLFALAAAAAAMPVSLAAAAPPVVVELFTSQGCSSCPPAEAYLGELARRPDVIALEFHIDYWDYIGWKDPFAKHAYTVRQRAYAEALGGRYVYTPQLVIDGRSHVVGSKRRAVEAKIEEARAVDDGGPALQLSRRGESEVAITIGAGRAEGTFDVYFVAFDRPHETAVMRGENRGRTLVNTNVVRELERVGTWSGAPVEIVVPLAGKHGNGGCAVLVQAPDTGPIIAGAILGYGRN